MSAVNRRVVLAARPHGEPTPADFRMESAPVPQPGPGEVLLRTRWLSLDPYMRGRMSDAKSYAAPVEIGAPITAETVGEVVATNKPGFSRRRPAHRLRRLAGVLRHRRDGLAQASTRPSRRPPRRSASSGCRA